MSGTVSLLQKLLLHFSAVALILLPATATKCGGQTFADNLRYPLVVGVGEVVETSKSQPASLTGRSYAVAWDYTDHITGELKLEMLSNKISRVTPYPMYENQIHGAVQVHFTVERVTPYISGIYGTGWTRNTDPSNAMAGITVTMGGAAGGEVRLYRGTSVRASYEITRWPPVVGFNGGYSRVVGISLTQHLSFVSRDPLN